MMASSDAVEAAAYAAKYRKYERDYLRRINHLYFSNNTPDNDAVGEQLTSEDLLNTSYVKYLRALLPLTNLLSRRARKHHLGNSSHLQAL
ncbi:uncharacterized protein [Physcomitrium patens]|uniref:uncharacterized protein isoform X2 n=1 Tax=Physcomitrium patens TaxID=3218 RepID=UPI003CCCC0FF